MESKDDLNRSQNQRTTLAAFSKTLQRKSHVLKDRPNLLWQQMYNSMICLTDLASTSPQADCAMEK